MVCINYTNLGLFVLNFMSGFSIFLCSVDIPVFFKSVCSFSIFIFLTFPHIPHVKCMWEWDTELMRDIYLGNAEKCLEQKKIDDKCKEVSA